MKSKDGVLTMTIYNHFNNLCGVVSFYSRIAMSNFREGDWFALRTIENFNPFEPEFSRTHVDLQENYSCFALLN